MLCRNTVKQPVVCIPVHKNNSHIKKMLQHSVLSTQASARLNTLGLFISGKSDDSHFKQVLCFFVTYLGRMCHVNIRNKEDVGVCY